MKEVINTLKGKKLQLFFLFYVLLLVPILCPLAENLTFWNKTGVFFVCGMLYLAIAVLSLFIDSKSEKIIYSVLLAISVIPGSIYLAYLLFAGVLLEQNSVTSLFETNTEESKEFVAYYISIWVIVGVLIYAAIPIVMICLMKPFKRLSKRKYKVLFGLSLAVIITIISVNKLSRSVYFINIYKTYIFYKIRTSHEIKSIKARQSFDYTVDLANNNTPMTLVVVIGESLSKHHMSLYGYPRNTNPLLSSLGDSIIIYNDIVSPQVHTIPVMRSLLSMNEPKHPEYFTQKPSLFELFKRAGFKTYLISNQEFSEDCRSSYDILLTLADKKYNLVQYRQHDDIVLPVLDIVLNEDDKKNKLILIHLIGNHMAYEFRYPKEYIVFNNKKDSLVRQFPYMDETDIRTVDKYDNSVLYNDYLIYSIIRSLQNEKNSNTAMIYLSDHAEELYDYRQFAGHAYEKISPAMCEIPFIVWMSPYFRDNRNDLIFNTMRPYSTADFIFSVSNFAGLCYTDYDDSRSLFSKSFTERERFVGNKKYKDIKQNFENKK